MICKLGERSVVVVRNQKKYAQAGRSKGIEGRLVAKDVDVGVADVESRAKLGVVVHCPSKSVLVYRQT